MSGVSPGNLPAPHVQLSSPSPLELIVLIAWLPAFFPSKYFFTASARFMDSVLLLAELPTGSV